MGLSIAKFKNLLAAQPKIALDSSCFIYHIGKNRQYIELTRIIFKELLPKATVKAIGSTLILAEILTKPYKLDRPDLALAYKTLIQVMPNFYLFAPNEQICDHAARIRSKYGFKTPDAIHIATAIEEGASTIVGNDKKWKRVKEIKTIILEDFA